MSLLDKSDTLLLKGLNFIKLGKFNEAIKCCNEAININPINSVAWYMKGAALNDPGKYEEAIMCYDEAIRIDPEDKENAKTWILKGSVLDKLEKYDEAIKCYDEALRIDPGDFSTRIVKGIALNKLGQDNEGFKCFDDAIRINSSYTDSRDNKMLMHENLIKIKALDNAIRSNKDNIFAWYKKGSILYDLEKYDEAIECLNEAIRIRPKDINSWRNKGLALYKLNKYDEAIKCFNEVLMIDPKDIEAENHRVLSLEKLKNQEESIRNSINTNGNKDIKIKDRTLIIKFYDDIQRDKTLSEKLINLNNLLNSTDSAKNNLLNNIRENRIFVNYSGIDLSIDIISKDFIGYWKKIIYNLGEDNQFGFNLGKFIEEIIKDGIKKEDDIISKFRNDLNIKIIKEDRRFKKIYKSTLNINPNIPFSLVYLKCSWGGENTYAPLSVVAFLQYIIQNLSSSELKNFNDVIKLYPKESLDFYMKNY